MKEPEPPPEPSQPTPTYRPDVFDVGSMESAKRIVLTPEPGRTSDERWQIETPFLLEDITSKLPIQSKSCVLDFGCGVGRVAKGLIERVGCRVVGVDISASMRALAPEYVSSERFEVRSPKELEAMIADGFRVDFCVCVWVLQHVLRPLDTLSMLGRVLRPGGQLYAINEVIRCVPTDQGWFSDNFDMQEGLRSEFVEEHCYPLPRELTTRENALAPMIQVVRKPAG